MGVRVDLVERRVYQFNPNEKELRNDAKIAFKEEITLKALDELKAKLLTARERFLLSDKDDVPSFNPKKKVSEKEKFMKQLEIEELV